MGCNNSHLRPFFRRCRRRSKNKEDGGTGTGSNSTPKRQSGGEAVIDSNHVDPNSSSNDLLHGFQFLGSSMKHSPASSSDQPTCVPLLAQSELSHSQIDFFKMLDEKIQQGPDYDSEDERQETERLIKNNIETWRRTIENSSASWSGKKQIQVQSKGPCSSKSASTGAKSNRCQWDDEGD